MAKTGLKICREAANQIRRSVASEIAKNGHVDPAYVRDILKPFAEYDAKLHQAADRNFHFGFGPAVENREH